uniref:Uncharacterized protein n=1 Tax=Arundo donax TaxID=35708 RepID=A0A0A9C9W8_ARUDO
MAAGARSSMASHGRRRLPTPSPIWTWSTRTGSTASGCN